MPLHWNQAYRTGFKTIDNQHKRLFDCVNEMEDLLNQDEISETKVKILTKFLTSYVKGHFMYEESCMSKHQCPVSKQNKKAHTRFIKFYKESMDTYKAEGPSREWLIRLHDTAEEWLVIHICRIDVQLRSCSRHRVLEI